MTKEELIVFIEYGNSIREISKITNKGYGTIKNLLNKYGLKTKNNVYNKKQIEPIIKTKSFVCKFCKNIFVNGFSLGGHLPFCLENPNKENNLNSIREGNKKNKHIWTKEMRENASIRRSKIIGELGVSGFKNVKTYSIKCETTGILYNVRGSWEYKIALWLNHNKIGWTNRIYLKYFDGSINRTYNPDFYLVDFDIYLEVKGYFKEKDKLKMLLVKQQKEGIKIFIIDQKIIKRLPEYGFLEEILTNLY